MNRRLIALAGAAVCALAAHAPSAHAAPSPLPSAGTLHGTVVTAGWSSLTIRTHTRRLGVIQALDATADRVAAGQYPYVWGGGHAAAGSADVGIRGGPGHNGTRVGFDCSGTVAAVLSGAGLWTAGTGVPTDAGIISALRQAGTIVRGAAHGPHTVTLWDDHGVHIFMEIGDRFFGTSDGGAGAPANPNGGAGWLDDGASDTHLHRFHAFHLMRGALRGSVLTGPTLTVGLRGELANSALELLPGRRVRVSYRTLHHALVAMDVSSRP